MAANDQAAPAANGMGGNVGGSITDVVSTLKGLVQNVGQLVGTLGDLDISIDALSTATLGGTLGGTTSPLVTIVTAISTTSGLVIAANSARLGIMFHSPNPSGVNMWVVPSSATAVAGRGLLIVPGDRITMPSTCGWNAIATSGSANVLTVLEFV